MIATAVCNLTQTVFKSGETLDKQRSNSPLTGTGCPPGFWHFGESTNNGAVSIEHSLEIR